MRTITWANCSPLSARSATLAFGTFAPCGAYGRFVRSQAEIDRGRSGGRPGGRGRSYRDACALTKIALITVGLRVWQDRPRRGLRGGFRTWASGSACDPGVAVWTIGWSATRTVERQSG